MSALSDDDFADPSTPTLAKGLRDYGKRPMRLRAKRELLEEAAIARSFLRNDETLAALESAALEYARVANEGVQRDLLKKGRRP